MSNSTKVKLRKLPFQVDLFYVRHLKCIISISTKRTHCISHFSGPEQTPLGRGPSPPLLRSQPPQWRAGALPLQLRPSHATFTLSVGLVSSTFRTHPGALKLTYASLLFQRAVLTPLSSFTVSQLDSCNSLLPDLLASNFAPPTPFSTQ